MTTVVTREVNMYTLPTKESLELDNDGYLVLEDYDYEKLSEEASIAASETGADHELDFDMSDFIDSWISRYLGTECWIALNGEPDDYYDYDKYH